MSTIKFPDWEEFRQHLIDEQHVKPTSFIKSAFTYITNYFENREYSRLEFRRLITELRTGSGIKNRPISTNSINKYILVGKYIDTYLKIYHGISEIQDYKAFPTKEPKKRKIIMTDEQMVNIAECIIQNKRFRRDKSTDRQDRYNHLWKTIFHLLRLTGMPPDDLCNLQWEDDYGTHFEIVRNKTGKKRIVPIVAILRELLDQLPKYPHGYIFGSDRGRLKPQTINQELSKRLKFLQYDERITAYCYRYSVTTLTVINSEGRNLPELAKIFGHTIDTMHRHYLQYDVQRLLDVLEANHPGLKGSSSIDTLKRVATEALGKIFEGTPYEGELNIKLREDVNSRKIYFS